MSTFFHRYLHTLSSSQPKSSIISYLTQTLSFTNSKALKLLNKFSTPETNPQSVIQYLTSHGFKPTDIHSWVTQSPQILFSNPHKTLKSRLHFFQDLGLKDQNLSNFISKNPHYISNKFEERLKPCIDIVKRLVLDGLSDDVSNESLVRMLARCNWVDIKEPAVRISANLVYLKQCGIVGGQLATVVTRQPRLLIMGEVELRALVTKVLDMGFCIESRMFVHGVHTVSCLSDETFGRKCELFGKYGFSKGEFLEMFRRAPGLLRVSEGKLRCGFEFFLNEVGFDKMVLVRRPTCLMLSLEERVIPRFRVLNVMMEKKVLKKMPKFLNVMWLPESEFLEKFIAKDRDYAEELLEVYKSGVVVAE